MVFLAAEIYSISDSSRLLMKRHLRNQLHRRMGLQQHGLSVTIHCNLLYTCMLHLHNDHWLWLSHSFQIPRKIGWNAFMLWTCDARRPLRAFPFAHAVAMARLEMVLLTEHGLGNRNRPSVSHLFATCAGSRIYGKRRLTSRSSALETFQTRSGIIAMRFVSDFELLKRPELSVDPPHVSPKFAPIKFVFLANQIWKPV